MDTMSVSGTGLRDAAPPADETLGERVTGLDVHTGQPAWHSVRDLLFVVLAFSSGAVDAISFLAFGKVFTAFQTGNLVFLGLLPGGGAGPDLLRVAVSLLAFAAGIVVSARIVKPAQDRGFQVWPRRVVVSLSVVAVAQACFLVGWIASSAHPSNAVGNVLVAFSAFSMGVQLDSIRSLRVPEVSTTAATATLAGLMNDIAKGTQGSAKGRAVRPLILLALSAGAGVGTLLLVHARTFAPVLPLIATVLVIAIASAALKPQSPR
jgi:uncharacterized membrane protein YoaK (UPF0700 family)